MELTIYQVDAFANKVFEGNPAAIYPLQKWLTDEVMQAIAEENNLSETAFFVAQGDDYELRWFTPTSEVDLCGHATLASAHVLFNHLGYAKDKIIFNTRSGPLPVTRSGEWLEMDFPSQPGTEAETPIAIKNAFGLEPLVCLKSEDYIVVFEDERDVINANPDLPFLRELDLRGVCITAKGTEYDFVSRFFAPNYGIDEDPVTGSAFTQLVPYWANALDKQSLFAKQVSARGGEARCMLNRDRVNILGKAVTYLTGTISM